MPQGEHAVKDLSNPAVIRFLNECYEKENLQRLSWVLKNEEKIKKAAEFPKPPKNYIITDVKANVFKGGMAMVTRDFKSSGYNRLRRQPNDGEIIGIKNARHGHSIVDIGLGDPKEDPQLLPRKEGDISNEPIMRPVPPKVKEMLYQPEPGRVEYLDKRIRTLPEDRYYFTECSSWEYGWRLKDVKGLKKPMHPKVAVLMRTLKNRVGPIPDPPHYASPDKPSFCA